MIIVARDGEEVSIAEMALWLFSKNIIAIITTTLLIEEGVNLHFEQNVDDLSQFADSDII